MLARRLTVPDPVMRLNRMLRGLSPVRGNLEVGDEINRGAYGVVFKGRLRGEPVAVKKIHKLHQTEATAETLCGLFGGLLEEGKMLAKIDHPHIVRGLGAFFDEDSQQPVIVMELMLVDLRTYIENNQGSLKMSKQIQICLQIAQGVQFLHHLSPPIAHRDLNDKNVMLAEDGTVKIGDLGQSKYKSTKEFFSTLVPGAALYMPPEATIRVGNDRACYTESVDIFSLGVLAVEVATGSPLNLPVPDGREEYLKRMGNNHPLKPLVKKCLSEKYRKRPDIDQVINEITPLAIEYDIATVRHKEEMLEHMKDVLRDIEREIAEVETQHTLTEHQFSAHTRLGQHRQKVERDVADLSRECIEMKQQIIDKHLKAKKFKFSSKSRKEVKHFKKELKFLNHKSKADSQQKRWPRFFQFRRRMSVNTVLTTVYPKRRKMRRITSDPGLTSDVERLVVMSTQERPLLTTSKSTASFHNSY